MNPLCEQVCQMAADYGFPGQRCAHGCMYEPGVASRAVPVCARAVPVGGPSLAELRVKLGELWDVPEHSGRVRWLR